MKRQRLYCCVIILLITVGSINSQAGENTFYSSLAATDEFDFPFEDAYTDAGLYLHALANFDYHPRWHFEWQKNLFSGNALQITTGSVTSKELLVDGQLMLNQDLSKGWWFSMRGLWRSTFHHNKRDITAYLGLERQIIKNSTIFLLFHPRYDKEFADAQIGFSLYGKNRQQYLNLAMVIEDFSYDHKNDRGGETNQMPIGMQWFLRYGKGKWWIYSDGNIGTGFKRSFPDPEKSPLTTSHQQQVNYFNVKLFYKADLSSLLELSIYQYRFVDAKTFYQSENDYDYRNVINDVSIQYVLPFREKYRLRLLTHYVHQEAKAVGYRQHEYSRDDIIPAAFLEWIQDDHMVDVGYMFTWFNWSYVAGIENRSYQLNDGYFDKIYLGYTYQFNANAVLHISISHQIKVSGFGGANAQYMMFF
jgi:hypothetical protein